MESNQNLIRANKQPAHNATEADSVKPSRQSRVFPSAVVRRMQITRMHNPHGQTPTLASPLGTQTVDPRTAVPNSG